jgi:hypothetical protein
MRLKLSEQRTNPIDVLGKLLGEAARQLAGAE